MTFYQGLAAPPRRAASLPATHAGRDFKRLDLPAARALAKEMTQNSSPIANTVLRHMLWRMLGASHPIEAHRIDTKGIDELGVSPDAKEGIQAFLEKRPPEFPGKVSQDLPSFFPWWEEPSFEDH